MADDESSSPSSLLIQVSETLPTLELVHDFLSSSSPGCGAASVFVGITRDNFDGKVVTNLLYEGYTPMAIRELRAISRDARWPIPAGRGSSPPTSSATVRWGRRSSSWGATRPTGGRRSDARST